MAYLFQPVPQSELAVADSDVRIAVRRIFCVGRNYAAHAREMGRDPDREPPFFFYKPVDAIVSNRATVPYPPQTQNLQFEGELACVIGKDGANIPQSNALDYVWGYAIANDLTRRDIQSAAKELGRPWDMGKGFDHSVPISEVHSVEKLGHLTHGRITTTVNGTVRQSADIQDMIWSVPETVSILSHTVKLRAGDVILTGTPAGVGTLTIGDTCVVSIEGLGNLTTEIGALRHTA